MAVVLLLSAKPLSMAWGGRLLLEGPSDAQEMLEARFNPRDIHTPRIYVDVNMVILNVSVEDTNGNLVTSLDRTNFQVFDDKVEQSIAAFSRDDVPVSIGIILDTSGSMRDKLRRATESVQEFMKSANPHDEFMLITVGARPALVLPFTEKPENVQDLLFTAQADGTTALLDAIDLGLREMSKAHNARKALLVVSDGGDNHSRVSWQEIKRAVREADVSIYSVGIFEPLPIRLASPEEAAGPDLLNGLSKVSGGRMYSLGSPDVLPDVMKDISLQLRNEYVIGYRPSNLLRDGRWRRIKVKLALPQGFPQCHSYARAGYYAPTR